MPFLITISLRGERLARAQPSLSPFRVFSEIGGEVSFPAGGCSVLNCLEVFFCFGPRPLLMIMNVDRPPTFFVSLIKQVVSPLFPPSSKTFLLFLPTLLFSPRFNFASPTLNPAGSRISRYQELVSARSPLPDYSWFPVLLFSFFGLL